MNQTCESGGGIQTTIADARRWHISGSVQGVGYRPFVYRLAQTFNLCGWVRNTAGAVEIHAEGPADRLRMFGLALLEQRPMAARAHVIDGGRTVLESRVAFEILESGSGGEGQGSLPLDTATCSDCLRELKDSQNRRFRYPFINCTQCGPRYTIMRRLPYDRGNTTVERFALCAECALEYASPLDRRFHAQPVACGICGPTLNWSGVDGAAYDEAALGAALGALRRGLIIAVRGIGGYHLMCDASNDAAVIRLRVRKGRPGKPFAVMVPWQGDDGLDHARDIAELAREAVVALSNAARPIVVVPLSGRSILSAAVAPGLLEVGLMMPYSPLHTLLLGDLGVAVVATSANLPGEPVLTCPAETQRRLAAVADGFLHHDRPIARPTDDAVVRFVAGATRPIRLGRGTAPLEFELAWPVERPTLAVGAHSKSTVALAWGHRVVVSPHISDQSTPRGRSIFTQIVADLQTLYGVRAEQVVHDAHPHFASSRWARASGLTAIPVWHHHAHANAVVGEYSIDEPLLCFTWDGIGLGPDGALWGGEALLGLPGAWHRVASFRPFRQLGGDRAAREPWRSALALCWDNGVVWPVGEERAGPLLRQAFDSGINSPFTTAVGRLFDAAASLIGICHESSYEGEAPMRLEAFCKGDAAAVELPLVADDTGLWRSDWTPLIGAMLDQAQSVGFRASQFHSSLAQALCEQAVTIRRKSGVKRVGLVGGVFQNKILTERAASLLVAAGFDVVIPERLPLNDAGISFGQVIEATVLRVP